MIPLDEALARVTKTLSPVGVERVPLTAGAGRTLAEDVRAARAQPPHAVSAMDGYAVRAADLGAGAALTLAPESRAGGGPPPALKPGEAAPISTGARLPEGADQVVMREEAERLNGGVLLKAQAKPGHFVRPAGLDFSAGETVLEAGDTLSPERLALAAAAGAVWLSVRRRPVLHLLCNGDELIEPGEPAREGAIINANAVGLVALFERMGAQVRYGGALPDDAAAVRAGLEDGASGADLIVTVGGASVGEHDHLKDAARALGGALLFETIAVRPGKPTWFAAGLGAARAEGDAKAAGGAPVLGLPGNPVSALVMGRLMGGAAIRALLAKAGAQDVYDTLPLAEALPENGPRETFLRAVLTHDPNGGAAVRALANQDSSALTALAAADVLIRRPANAPRAEAGARTPVIRLDGR